MNSEVEFHIRQNYQWAKLPVTVKQVGSTEPFHPYSSHLSFTSG